MDKVFTFSLLPFIRWQLSVFFCDPSPPPHKYFKFSSFRFFKMKLKGTSVLECLNNLWRLGTAKKNWVVVPARQATQPGVIGSLESILGLLKSWKIRLWRLFVNESPYSFAYNIELETSIPLYIVGRYLSVPSRVLRFRLKSFSLLSKMGFDSFFSLCYSWCDTCSRRLPYQHFRFSEQKRDGHSFLLISLPSLDRF